MISILYVDDESDLLTLAKIYLERTGGFTVDTCTSAIEALKQIDSRSYDAILSDYQMPGMDGIEFLKQVRSAFGNIPFILFTGKGREEVVIKAIDNGVDFYIQKGGDPRAQFAELAHKVQKSVERNLAIRAFSKSEERMRLALEAANEGLWDENIVTGEVFFSPRVYEMLGYSPDNFEKLSKIPKNMIHPDDRPATEAALQAYYEGKTDMYQVKQRLRTRSGDWKWIYSRGKFVEWDTDGKPIRFIGTYTDLTDIKKAESALQENRNYLNLIFLISKRRHCINRCSDAQDIRYQPCCN